MSLHSIYVDDEVFAELQKMAIALKDTPNRVLRKVLSIEKCPRCSGDNIDLYTEEPLKLCSDCGLIFNPDGTFISESDRDSVRE